MRASTNRPVYEGSNQAILANAIQAALRTQQDGTEQYDKKHEAGDIKSVMGRWLSKARGYVSKGLNRLIDLKRADYRRQAGLTERKIQVGTHQISYLDRVPGDALALPVVMLLHGFCGDKDMWVLFAIHLSKSWRLIIPDLPGFGDSSRNPEEKYDCKTQSQRLFEFATALNIQKFHVVGSSMGGNIAGRMAIDSSERIDSLTLFDALGVGSPILSPVGQEMLVGRNPLLLESVDGFEDFIKLSFVNPPPMPAFVMRHLAQKIVLHRDFNRKVFIDLANFSDELTNELSNVRCKTLIVWGDSDKIIDVSAASVFQTKIPQAQTAIVQNCGHVPMVEQPQHTAQILNEFITLCKRQG